MSVVVEQGLVSSCMGSKRKGGGVRGGEGSAVSRVEVKSWRSENNNSYHHN